MSLKQIRPSLTLKLTAVYVSFARRCLPALVARAAAVALVLPAGWVDLCVVAPVGANDALTA